MRPQWPVGQQICHLERRVAVPVPAADKDGSVDLRQKASASEGGNGSRRRPLRRRSSLAPPAQDDVDVADDADDDEVQHIPAPANQILGSGAMGQPKWYSWRNEQTEEWWDPYDSNDDDVLREFLEDDLGHIVAGMVRFTEHHEKYLNRAEYRIPKVSAEEWVQNMLSSRDSCYDLFRMSPTMFYRLHEVLVESYGLQSTSKSSSIEALGMFLWMVGGQQSFRTVQHILTRSTGTIHKNFVKVLECLVKLSDDILTPRDPEFRTIHPKLQEARFHGLFNNCIGAIDGTHIPCIVPSDKVIEYMNRKGKTSQNVMAICDFDMRFIFVNAGWPGSVHDMRVFNGSRTRWSDRFPHPPQGKYYLVDSGYPNRPGYLAPYRQTKYHVPEFRQGPAAEGKQEIFNYHHSSLRNIVERAFGVMKMKWRILLEIPSYPLHRQTDIIKACFALHNFMQSSGIVDRDFESCQSSEQGLTGPDGSVQQAAVPLAGPDGSVQQAVVPADTVQWQSMDDLREWIANGLVSTQ